MRTEIACPTCLDEGTVLVEEIVAVPGHAYECDGDSCSFRCPVPVPELNTREERCPDCGGQT